MQELSALNNKLHVIKSFLVGLGAARPPRLESICLINSHKATRIHSSVYRSGRQLRLC